MFGPFDEMFDFNRDGELNPWERAAEYQFMEDMLKSDYSSDDYGSGDDYGFDSSDY